jgi:SAM-dependent methyltransferase
LNRLQTEAAFDNKPIEKGPRHYNYKLFSGPKMKEHLTRRDDCRLCGGIDLELVLPIAPSPIGDAYVPKDKLGEAQGLYPLDLYLCRGCGHVQNVDIVDPEILFRDYTYVTSSSAGLVDHYRRYSDEVVARFSPAPESLVVEIGSNDGTLLRFFREHRLRVIGVDPATRIATEASASGIPTLPEFFDQPLGRAIREQHGAAAIVTANNVFAHSDDLAGIIRGVRSLLADDGVFVFEVSYLVDIVDRFLFDTVYHEHVSYHSVAPLKQCFERNGMQLFDVQRIGSKGGSIRGFAQKFPEGQRTVAPIIGELLADEALRGFARPDIFRSFGEAINLRKAALNAVVDEARSAGKKVAGYGASTTVTTLMWHFDLTQKLEFLADDNPRKQGLFSPRCHIPVLPSAELYVRRPDYVVILAWNYAGPIIKSHQRFLDEGGKFVIPLPHLKVV